MRSEKLIYDWFQTRRNMIVVAVFLLIMNQTELRLVSRIKKYCDYDHFPFNLKGIRNRFRWVHVSVRERMFIDGCWWADVFGYRYSVLSHRITKQWNAIEFKGNQFEGNQIWAVGKQIDSLSLECIWIIACLPHCVSQAHSENQNNRTKCFF